MMHIALVIWVVELSQVRPVTRPDWETPLQLSILLAHPQLMIDRMTSTEYCVQELQSLVKARL